MPGLNIISSLIRMKKYSKYRKELDNIIKNTNLFIKLDEEEFNKFLDNPKSINAFNISFDYNTLSSDFNKPKGFIKISNGNYRQDNGDGTFNDIDFRKEDEYIVVTSIKGELTKLDEQNLLSELNKIFFTLYKKTVVIEKKSDITLEKEMLIQHREDIIDSCLEDNSLKLKLK